MAAGNTTICRAPRRDVPLVQTVPMNRFDKATLKLEGAMALTSTMGMLLGGGGGEQPGEDLINSAMSGIRELIESAVDDLLAKKGGAA